MSPMLRGCCAVLAASALLHAAQAPPLGALSRFDRCASIERLRQIKSDPVENYSDKAHRGIDVAALYADTEQKLKAARSAVEPEILLADVLLRFDDSHPVFYPPE